MGCGGCGNNRIQPNHNTNSVSAPQSLTLVDEHLLNNKVADQNVFKNLRQAALQQPDKLLWFKDGISKIIKCLKGKTLYFDEDIQKNRDVCRECQYSTKDSNGKLTLKSQCMAPDPEKNNAPCGCFIVCKTQTGFCPQKKWTTTVLTVKRDGE